jgi:hypothetical protein
MAGHEAKILGKNGAAVSPFPTCLIHSVVLVWFIEHRDVLTLPVPTVVRDYILCMTCIWSTWSQQCSCLPCVSHFGNTLEVLVLWYVFPGGKIMFLVQFFDIGSHGDLSFQKIHECFDKARHWTQFWSTTYQVTCVPFIDIFFLNTILQCMLRSCEWSLPMKISNQNVACDVSSWWICFPSFPRLIVKTVVDEEGKLWSSKM